ncbi:hypothetical protein M885DRAFT_622868 [Pelagophyceae sp. CCMP2097]|nr:hypothetical protein M885DRAFT_622868 [Pelagophyceae sp. CCMP2097]
MADTSLTLTAARTWLGDVVAFYGLAKELHRGGVVFVETLDLDQKLTADHELYRIVYGQRGATAQLPCWACNTKMLDERQGAAPAEERTLASLYACARLFPHGAKPGTAAMKANAFCSIEHNPLLPVYHLYTALAETCAKIDGVADAEAATRIAHTLLASKERCDALCVTVQEAAADKLETTTALAAAETRFNAALDGAQQLVADALAEVERLRVALAAISELVVEATAARMAAFDALYAVEAAAKVGLGPMAQCLCKMLDKLHVRIQAFYQMFIGNRCYTLLKNTRILFAELGTAAAAVSADAAATFEVFATATVPLWESLYQITKVSLAARILSDEEVAEFKVSCLRYQRLAYCSDTSNALKRHMYTHLWKFAEENRTVGLFAESAFESIHARYNAIERRYNHIISLELRDVAIRQALALQQDREARAACATQHVAVARGPRAAT